MDGLYNGNISPDDTRFDYFKNVYKIEKLDMTLLPFGGNLNSAGVALVTFLYLDFLFTSGNLMALMNQAGMTDKNGDFPRSRITFAVDAISTMFGSLFMIWI